MKLSILAIQNKTAEFCKDSVYRHPSRFPMEGPDVDKFLLACWSRYPIVTIGAHSEDDVIRDDFTLVNKLKCKRKK